MNGEKITVNWGGSTMEGVWTCWIEGGKTINRGLCNVNGNRNTGNGRKIGSIVHGGGRKYLWTKWKFINGGENTVNGGRNNMKEGGIYIYEWR